MYLPTFFITYKLQIIWFKGKEISTKLCMIFASEILVSSNLWNKN